MIPILDNVRGRKKPIVTCFLIGINIAIFLWELKLDLGGELGSLVNNWGVIPAQINAAIAPALAGNPAAWIFVVIRSSSLLAGMFLHGSFSQIVGNLLFLWVFGKSLEKSLGHGRFIVFYLLGGVFTGMVQILAEPNLTVPLIGANGAIASILGGYALKFPSAKVETVMPLLIIFVPITLPAGFYLFWWFVQQLFYGIGSLNIPGGFNQPTMGYWAQIAGLLIGAAFMRLLQRRK
jgi:membrane associated rhomboid family serine protease